MSRPPSSPDGPDHGGDVVPEPDAAPTVAEKAQARAFGELLDKALAGRTPPAMAADDRELLEVATIIRAVSHPAELSAARTSAVVESALGRAVGEPARPSVSDPGIVPLAARRGRGRVPWAIAAVSSAVAAAAVVMLVTGLGRRTPATTTAAPAAAAAEIPTHWRSRPADDLIGVIPHERSGDAGARIDAIFADRLDGYRERTLAGKTQPRPRSKP